MSVTRVPWPVPATFLPKTVEKLKTLSSTITVTPDHRVFHRGASSTKTLWTDFSVATS